MLHRAQMSVRAVRAARVRSSSSTGGSSWQSVGIQVSSVSMYTLQAYHWFPLEQSHLYHLRCTVTAFFPSLVFSLHFIVFRKRTHCMKMVIEHTSTCAQKYVDARFICHLHHAQFSSSFYQFVSNAVKMAFAHRKSSRR